MLLVRLGSPVWDIAVNWVGVLMLVGWLGLPDRAVGTLIRLASIGSFDCGFFVKEAAVMI